MCTCWSYVIIFFKSYSNFLSTNLMESERLNLGQHLWKPFKSENCHSGIMANLSRKGQHRVSDLGTGQPNIWGKGGLKLGDGAVLTKEELFEDPWGTGPGVSPPLVWRRQKATPQSIQMSCNPHQKLRTGFVMCKGEHLSPRRKEKCGLCHLRHIFSPQKAVSTPPETGPFFFFFKFCTFLHS